MSDHSADETLGPDEQPPHAEDATLVPAVSSEQAGQQFDRYKLLEPIGEGGFGTVWAAEQREPVKRRVALKIIKLGMDTKQVIARFEAERQALAMMDHPNIAKVFDAGSTDTGRPFFVMELVKGVPIIEYCDREKLDTKARLDLFTKVCHAIQHAHQKGIIHRDIKPSNVLVTLHDGKPVPKVIDFGIAKATNQELTETTVYTQHRQMIGTPAYMSPEQAEMSGLDIDTRSDIYSLGVLLYEMLTGTTPFSHDQLNSAGFEGMMKLIREVEPHKPSTRLSSLGETGTRTAEQRRAPDVKRLGLILRGDLDWIVMKCLEKDRTRRYDTANGLAEDIRRHLSDEPVSASPPSAGYRLRKFVKRNKGQVAAGSAIAALLVLGIIGTTWGMAWAIDEKTRADEQAELATMAAESERVAKLEAQENAERAIEEAERAEAAEAEATKRAEELQLVADFQAEQLGAIEPEVMGINIRRSLIDAVAEKDRAAFEDALAQINFTSLALATLEDNIFERTIDAIDTQFAEQPLVRAQLLHTVADTLRELGLLELATEPQKQAMALRREHLGDDHPDTLRSISNMGVLLKGRGRFADAQLHYQEAAEGLLSVLGADHPETLRIIANMAVLLKDQGRFAEAEVYYREAVEGLRRVLGDDHPDTLGSINNLGTFLETQGELSEAEQFLSEALSGYRRLLGDDHPNTLASISSMGFLLYAQGKPAEPYFREAMVGCRRVLGDDHPLTLTCMHNLGAFLRRQGKPDEAELYLRDAMEGRRRVLGPGHADTLSTINSIAVLLDSQGRLAEAEEYYREALQGFRRGFGADHPETLRSISNLGSLLREQSRFDEAEGYHREAVDGYRRVLGDDHPTTLNSISFMGYLYLMWGRPGKAETFYREAVDGYRRVLGEAHPDTLVRISNLALVLAELGQGEEALALCDEAVEAQRRESGDGHWLVGNFIGKRARAYQVLGRFAEAAQSGREAHAILSDARGEEHEQTQRVIGYLAEIYEAWHEAEPEEGYDAKAAEWRAKVVGTD